MLKLKSFVPASVVIALFMTLTFQATVAEEAVSPNVSSKIKEAIKKGLETGRPGFDYSNVTPTPIKGLYQVRIPNGPMLYTNHDGSYFVVGDLYQVKAGEFINLAEEQRNEERATILAGLDLSEQIIFSPKGKTRGHVTIFTDIDCGYCRKLHQEVPELNAQGVEVRYLAFPRAGLQSASYNKVATAWCAKNPQEALTKLKNREHVEEYVCEGNPIAKQYALGSKMGVNGTPAMFLSNGRMMPGYMPAKDLIKAMGL